MSSIIVIIIFVLKGRRFRSGKCTSAAHLLTETYYELIYSIQFFQNSGQTSKCPSETNKQLAKLNKLSCPNWLEIKSAFCGNHLPESCCFTKKNRFWTVFKFSLQTFQNHPVGLQTAQPRWWWQGICRVDVKRTHLGRLMLWLLVVELASYPRRVSQLQDPSGEEAALGYVQSPEAPESWRLPSFIHIFQKQYPETHWSLLQKLSDTFGLVMYLSILNPYSKSFIAFIFPVWSRWCLCLLSASRLLRE